MTRNLETINLSEIESAGNVRRNVGSVRELAYSLDRVGLLNPVTVRANGSGWELVAGHRRVEAARSLGWDTIPAIVLDETEEPGDRLAVQLIENLQREDLSALEEADGIAELVDLVGSQKAAAEAIGRSQAHVSKRLKVRELSTDAREAIESGALSLEDAFELTKVDDPAGRKKALKSLLSGSSYELTRQLDQARRDKVDRKAARDVAKQDHRQNVEVVATPDKGTGWASLEGWNGLAVDQDAHEAEPCHRLVVGHNGWADEVTEVYYCADPDRHGPEGDSDNKVETTDRDAEIEKRRQRAEAERAAFAEEQAKRAADALRIAAGIQDRNAALKVLARWVLDFDDGTHASDLLSAFGVDLPEEPAKPFWEDQAAWKTYEAEISGIIDDLPVATLYRAAILRVLTQTTHGHYPEARTEPTAQAIANLLGFTPDK